MRQERENLIPFNRIFERQLKNFNLDGLEWRFGYAKGFGECGRCNYSEKMITICREGGEKVSNFTFMKIVRHEFFHYKFSGRWFDNEIFASITEYIQLERL